MSLVTRFTEEQAELAAKISNDISEGIDCGESREVLRMAIAYWADAFCAEVDKRNAEERERIIRSIITGL